MRCVFGQRRRQHAALDVQDALNLQQRALHIAGYIAEGGDEQIAECVTVQAAAAEAVFHQLRHQALVLREGGDIAAQVPRRQTAHFAAQPARRAAIIADGNDGRDIGALRFEAAQDRRQPRAAANGHQARAAAAHAMGDDHIDNRAGRLSAIRAQQIPREAAQRHQGQRGAQ